MELIDKTALIAEIKRRIDLLKANESGVFHAFASEMIIIEYENMLSFLDTLEVKEMDLDYIKKELDDVVRIYKPNGDFGWGTLYNVATHFFELGLKAKGVEGICKISETNCPNFDEAQGTPIITK